MPKKATAFNDLKHTNAREGRLKDSPMNCVKIYREAKHMTQSELAEASGVHRTTIARLENQGGRPHRYMAEKIAEALDISVAQVYGVSVAPPYADASLYSPTKSGEYLCAFRRSGSHTFSYFVAYYDKDTHEWSIPPWMNFGASTDLPMAVVKWWTKIPELIEGANIR